MLAVQKWSQDKIFLIAVCAPHLVLLTQDMREEFQFIKQRRFAGQKFPSPTLSSWFAMYRSHKKMSKQVEAIWSAVYGKKFIGMFAKSLEMLRTPKSLQNMKLLADSLSPAEREEVGKEIKEIFSAIYSQSERELEQELEKAPLKPTAERRLRKLWEATPLESSFFVLVHIPCWFLYRMSPTTLYYKARHGDLEALDQLLRLDQYMLHDPSIGKQITKLSSREHREMIEAALASPKEINSRRNVLLSLLGLISAVSHLTKKPLTAPDLVKLVAAIDEDFNSNLAEDLPEDSRSLARALRPDRNYWRKIFKADKIK